MALDNIILVDAAAANKTYTFIGFDSAGKAIRKDLTRSIEEPCVLVTGHAVSGKTSPTDRHLSRLDLTVLDADGVTTYPITAQLTLVGLRKVMTSARMWDLYKQLTSRFTTEAAIAAFIQGQQ